MQNLELIHAIKQSKATKKLTMNNISEKAGIGIRTVNRIFAGEDVRFSSVLAVLDALEIDFNIHLRQAA